MRGVWDGLNSRVVRASRRYLPAICRQKLLVNNAARAGNPDGNRKIAATIVANELASAQRVANVKRMKRCHV
tara:strand:+ start:262 stop:477 length:216 start_codon:yes stop_codon:yes gene_type:complete